MKTRIAVLVSGGGTNLQALIDARDRGELPHGELALVVSNKEGAYALERAEKAGIPVAVCQRAKGEPRADFEARLLAILSAAKIDMIILAGFMAILSADFVSRYPERIINIHPSLIPSFCGEGFYGLRVHRAALDYGVKVTGATVHFVNEVPDGGRIIVNGDERAIDALQHESWRNQVLYIPQDPYIFHATLRENIAFYTPEAEEARILQAVETVGLAGLVEELPDGLDTVIGAGGRGLSGGQAQRIALARAFLDTSRRILVFDEPSAHLDIETEGAEGAHGSPDGGALGVLRDASRALAGEYGPGADGRWRNGGGRRGRRR
jgi:phosphoribosylglycinamide formyltransferase-1